MQKQSGFTLIELIMVVVILGILAATALPKFVDLSGDAEQAAADGVAGGILSSAVLQKSLNAMSSGAYTYTAAAACAGDYLQGGATAMGSCSTTGSTSCAVTCGTGTKTVTLP